MTNELTVREEATQEESLVRRTMFKNMPADQVNMALLLCNRYGLDPILKHVVLISGNAYITRDGLLHVAHMSGQLDGMQTTVSKDDDGMYAECTVYRRDMSHPFTYRVYRAEYDNQRNAWKTHPRSMLIKTAEVFCLRRAFNVAITPFEEMQTVIPAVEVVDYETGEIVSHENTNGAHWIDDSTARKRFWMACKNKLGLSEADVYAALGVDSIHKWEHGKEAAWDALVHYAEQLETGEILTDAEQMELEEVAAK